MCLGEIAGGASVLRALEEDVEQKLQHSRVSLTVIGGNGKNVALFLAAVWVPRQRCGIRSLGQREQLGNGRGKGGGGAERAGQDINCNHGKRKRKKRKEEDTDRDGGPPIDRATG
jgi:hypothetical protein